MNRHYMKEAAPARLAAESCALLPGARLSCKRRPMTRWIYVSSLLPMAVGSVDRLEEIPDRLKFLFDFDAAGGAARATRSRERAATSRRPRGDRRAARRDRGARCSIATRSAPMANRVKERTGQKGKALFHPIRVALTGEGGGPSSIWPCRRSSAAPPVAARPGWRQDLSWPRARGGICAARLTQPD